MKLSQQVDCKVIGLGRLLYLSNIETGYLQTGLFSQVQKIEASMIDIVLSSIGEGVEHSIQRRDEKARLSRFTDAITILAPSHSNRDGQLLIKIGNNEMWELLMKIGCVERWEG